MLRKLLLLKAKLAIPKILLVGVVFSFLLLTLNIQLTAVEPVETAFATSSVSVSKNSTEHILISKDNSFTNPLWEETVVAASLKKTTKNSLENPATGHKDNVVLNGILNVTIICPPPITIQCGDSVDPIDTGTASIGFSDCSGNPTLNYTDVTIGCTIERTWTATDTCGSFPEVSCIQIITVVDSTAPIWTTAPGADITISCPSPSTFTPPTASDNCDTAPLITFQDVTVSGACLGTYTITRTWTAIYDCGNVSLTDVSQSITVEDITPPVLSVAPANVTVECSAIPAAATLTATDTCDAAPVVTYAEVKTNGTCANSYTLTRTWTAKDACNNESSKVQVITVEDTTPPVLNVAPANVTVECIGDVPAMTSLSWTDNCDTGSTVLGVDGPLVGGNCGGTITRTWNVSDACGNPAIERTQIITIDDTQAPTVTGTMTAIVTEGCDISDLQVPTNTLVYLRANGLTISDACGDGGLTVTSSDSTPSTTCPITLTRTYTVTDTCGNKTTKTQAITIDDTQAPTVTGTMTDKTTKTQAITIDDTQAPTWTTTANFLNKTIECSNAAAIAAAQALAPVATDNCGAVTYTKTAGAFVAGTCANSGTYTNTWIARDVCLNTSTTFTQVITIQDTTPPTWTTAANFLNKTIECSNAAAIAAAQALAPVATDNCGAVTYTKTVGAFVAGACANSGTYTNTWIARDVCLNATIATFIQVITIQDTTAPLITNDPTDYYAVCDGAGNTAELNVWLADNGGTRATDNCSGVTWSNNFTALSDLCGETGSALVTFTATDACGNKSTRSARFIIEDKVKPYIGTSASNLTVACDGAGNTSALTAWLTSNGGATAGDVCSSVTWSNNFTTLSDLCGATGSALVIFKATDACGNFSTTQATFTVEDKIKPTASNPAPIPVQCISAIPARDILVVTDEADNCATPSVSWLSESNNGGAGTTTSPYVLTRIYRVSDACGNFIDVSQEITAIDDIDPTITCPADIALDNDLGKCGAKVTITNPTASDNCSTTFTYSGIRSDGLALTADYPVGPTTINWTATDANGNTSTSCNQLVTITDNEKPTAICQNITVPLNVSTGTASITAADVNNNSTDNCGIQSLSLSKTNFDCTNIGPNTVTLTVTDAQGNMSTCNATVTITDLSDNASVTVKASETTFCEQATVTFEALPTNGGSNPSYQWYKNNIPLVDGTEVSGATTSFLTTSSTFAVSDFITVEMTSNISYCAETKPVKSNPLTLTVNSKRIVSFNINATATEICEGAPVTYSVNPLTIINGGTSPKYQWYVSTNGGANYTAISGATSASYIRSTIADGDMIALEVTSNVQCADPAFNSNTIQMTVNGPPTVIANASDVVICFGESVSLTGSGATSYTWDNGVTNGVAFSPAATKTYTVTGTDGNGCTNTDTITITVNPLPQVSASSNSPVCLGANINLTATFTPSGTSTSASSWSWTGPNGFTSSLEDPAAISASANSAGIYTVEVTDNNGCKKTSTTTVAINPDATISDPLIKNQSVCINNAITAINFNIGGGGSGATVTGLPTGVTGNYNSGSGVFTISGSPTVSGIFPYTLTTTGTCAQTTQSGTITVNPDATISLTSANNTQTVCSNAAISNILYSIGGGGTGATVTGLPAGITGVYNSGVVTISGSSLVTGTHNFTVTTTGTCAQKTATGSITINPNLTPTVSITSNDADNNICAGTSVTFTAAPVNGGSAPSYQWKVNGSNVGTNSPTFTSSTLNDNDVVNVVLTSNHPCLTASTATSNAITNNIYTTPATPSLISGSPSNCPVVTGLIYSVIPDDNIITYNWTVPPGYTITNGAGTNEITVTVTATAATGNFVVRGTNTCGTSTSSILDVTVGTGAIATAGADQSVCVGTASITLDGFVGGAINPKTKDVWWWSDNGAGGTVPSGNPIQSRLNGIYTLPPGAPAGTVITISIETIDPGGACGAAYDEMKIFILPNTTITNPENKTQIVCINNAIAPINFSITNGTGATVTGLPAGVTGSYSGGTYTISGTPTVSGTFSYTVTTTGSCVQASQTGTITVQAAPTVNAGGPNTVCQSASPSAITLTGASIGGGATTAAWSITSGSGSLSATAQTANPSGVTYTPAANYSGSVVLTLTTNAPSACSVVSATRTITVQQAPTVNAGGPDTVCQSSSPSAITLTGASIGGGATTGAWSIISGGGSLSTTAQTANPSSVTYTPAANYSGAVSLGLTTNAPSACLVASATRTITVQQAPTVNAGGPNTVCQSSSPSAITLTGASAGGGATTAAWSITSGGGNLSSVAQTANPSGVTYTPAANYSGPVVLTLTTNAPSACSVASATRTITVQQAPTVNAGGPDTVCQSSTPTAITLTGASVGGGATAAWSITSGGGSLSSTAQTANPSSVSYTPAANYSGSVVLTLTTTASSACSIVSATRTITVQQAPTVNAGAVLTACQSATPSAITLTGASVGGGATAAWSITSGGGSLSSTAQTANPESVSYTPAANYSGTVVLKLTTNAPSACSVVSATRNISIKAKVVISSQPQNVGVCANSQATLSVVAFGDITGYQWYRNGVAVPGATSNILNFSAANTGNAGNYYVVITGESPCSNVTSDIVTLNVNQLISITTQPTSLALCEGNTATFTVAATGSIASYQWKKDGVNLVGATNATLTISNVQTANEGNYSVEIIGVGGNCPSIISNNATLTVTLQPTATISYSASAFCDWETTQNVTLIGSNASGGTYSASPAGLNIDTDGKITPYGSSPGVYTVTYAIPASTCTVVNPSTTVEIFAEAVGGTTKGWLDTETELNAGNVVTACHLGDGTIKLSGYTGVIEYWQVSTNGGLDWTTIESTKGLGLEEIIFEDITQATAYRAVISSGVCQEAYSQITLVNIVPPDVKPSPVTADPTTFCLGGSVVFTSQSGLGTGLGIEDGGGDFDLGQMNTQDPLGWLVDGNPGGWTAGGDATKPRNWSGTNDHSFGGIYYDSGDKKFGIAQGPADADGHILETPVFNTYGLSVFEFRLDQAYNLFAGDRILIELSLDSGKTGTYNIVLQDVTVPAGGPRTTRNNLFDPFNTDNTIFTEDINGVSLNNYVGQPNLRIRLTYIGKTANSAWAIDNIQVEVDEADNGIEWTNEQGEIISTEHIATVTPDWPGTHIYGVTSLINGCRSEGVAGTVFVNINVNYSYAGEPITILDNECGNSGVTLNAYDNSKNTYDNFVKGAFDAYDASDPDGNKPGTGVGGEWIVLSGPSGCLGGSFSTNNPKYSSNPANDPDAIFTGDAGDYLLGWNVGGCQSTVLVTLTTCPTIDFDGDNDHITFKNNYGFESGSFSIEVWIKSELNNNDIQTILSKRDAANLSANGYDLRLQNRRLSFNWNSGGSLVSNYNIDTDRWYHVAVTFNGTTSTYKMYIDGIEVSTSTASNNPGTNNFDCILGAMDQNGKPLYYFNGWMDELRIWDKALNVEHIRQMMNQQIVSNGNFVRGEEVPIDIHGPDTNGFNIGGLTDDDPLAWANLKGYYRMNEIGCGNLLGYDDNGTRIGVDGKLRNIQTAQDDSAPLPYTTIATPDNDWKNITATSPWEYGATVWDHPNSIGVNGAPIEWNIVRASHNLISGNEDISLLGLLLDTPGTELTIANPMQGDNENNSGQGLFISHYLLLDGIIDLVGESQLIQKRFDPTQYGESILDNASTGYLERDQQGVKNSYIYNYWSSPVSARGTSNNAAYTVAGILNDGTVSSSPNLNGPINFVPGTYAADGALTTPIKISTRWIYRFNGTEDDYDSWVQIRGGGSLKTGEGYTMKGVSGTSNVKVSDTQNYVFIGKPHNGDITLTVADGDEYLIGNPYPSALDADEFILDNIKDSGGRNAVNVINGTLYFWDHFAVVSHVLRQYVGGYAMYNLTGGVNAISDDYRINNSFAKGTKVPSQYISVAQGFFVNTEIEADPRGVDSNINPVVGGDVLLRNNQRVFERDSPLGSSIFFKEAKAKSTATSAGDNKKVDTRSKIRLLFDSPNGYHRPLLLGVDERATNNFDVGFDAPLAEKNNEDMFWLIQNAKFIIQGVPNFDKDQEFPLGLKVSKAGLVRIKIDTLENIANNVQMYIKDKSTLRFYKINDKPFEMNLEIGNYLDRFSLVFSPSLKSEENSEEERGLGIEDGVLESKVQVYMNNETSEIKITRSINIAFKSVELYNILGQKMQSWNKNLDYTSLTLPVNLAAGVYLVQINTSKGMTSQKIVKE